MSDFDALYESRRFKRNAKEGSARLRDAIFRMAALDHVPAPTPCITTPSRKQFAPMRNVAVERVTRAVARFYRIPAEQISIRSQVWDCSHPRQVAMYVARELYGVSFPALGRHFGQKDHTSAIYACRKVKAVTRLLADAQSIIDKLKEPQKSGDNHPESAADHAIEQSMKTQTEMAA